MKKTLFWILFIPISILILVAMIIGDICERFDELANKFERWCYKEEWKDYE